MDTITHGIAGAIIGKGIFSERWGSATTLAATLGSVFPDCDTIIEIVSRDPLSLLKYHRGITHSFVAMPVFAVALGALVWWLARRRGIRASFWVLTLAALVGIASHILLDGFTSFGTRMWEPISWVRISWDWLFIIDPTLTALLLVPQVAAWVQSDRLKAPWRAVAMWLLLTMLAALTWGGERLVGARIRFAMVPVTMAILAAVFFLPLLLDRFFQWSRRGWCMGGLVLSIAYIVLCGFEHHQALERVRAFANSQRLPVESLAAVPLPPSPLTWNGLVRTPKGIYTAQIDPDGRVSPHFVFMADAPLNSYVEEAFHLPAVQTYLGFARFPIVRYQRTGGDNILELYDVRFFDFDQTQGGHPFTYRVIFSSGGKPLRQGWLVRPSSHGDP